MSQLPPPPTAVYIGEQREPIFAFFHGVRKSAPDIAVLMCPPFGWEDMCSYRSRREWACSLVEAGFATLRIDLPGSGDSGGSPRDPGRLQSWPQAVGICAEWLSRRTGAKRIAAIGIGLGSAIVYSATVEGAPIDDLVLWGAQAQGRRYVRELRAFSQLEAYQTSDQAEGDRPDDDVLAIAGYVMSTDTQRELEELDLTKLDCSNLRSSRVLMLERDGVKADQRLLSTIQGCGTQVTVSPGDGYAAMMMAELPHAVAAEAVFATVSSWLAQESALEASSPSEDPTSDRAQDAGLHTHTQESLRETSAQIVTDSGASVRETPITISHRLGEMFGILTEPLTGSTDLCAVWLNAGPQRRTGPNRMWVETARRWAAQGVPCLRLDLAAIGDAEGDPLSLVDVRSYYVPEYFEQVRLVLDTLQARGLPPRFLVGGLCAGAYWAFQIAQEDSRVAAIAVLNPGYLIYDGGLSNARVHARAMMSMLSRRSTWSRVLRGQVTPSSHLATMRTLLRALLGRFVSAISHAAAFKARTTDTDELEQAFDRLRERDQRALILFAGEEMLYSELSDGGSFAEMERWPNISLCHEAFEAEVHTLRPLTLQRLVNGLVDELLHDELKRLKDAQSVTDQQPVPGGF